MDVILDVEPVVFAVLHRAVERDLAAARGDVDVQTLETDVVVLACVHLRTGSAEGGHGIVIQSVDVTDEIADKFGLRVVVDLIGRADLLDEALVEHRDAVGERQRLLLIVGDEDKRDACVFLDLFHHQNVRDSP